MSVYAVPALIALLIKVTIIVLAIRGKHTSKLFFGLLGLMAAHNLCEVLVIATLFDGAASEWLLRSYYIAACFSLAYLCLFSIETSGWRNNRLTTTLVLLSASAMASLIGGTSLVIEGATALSYTVTAIKGSYYSSFLVFSCIALALIFYALLQGLRTKRTAKTQMRSGLMLLALSPIIVTTSVVVIAMQLGANFTGAMLLPIASSLFLYIALKTEHGHQIIDIRRYLPFSAERVTARRVNKEVFAHLNGEHDFKTTKELIERALLEHALDAEENVTWAAKRLGVRRSSFYSMLKRVGIETQQANRE